MSLQTFNRTVIGLDVGQSMVKAVAFDDQMHTVAFPSLTSTDVRSHREQPRWQRVEFRSRTFLFGETAHLQGGARTAAPRVDNWFLTDSYSVLARAAFDSLARRAVRGLNDPLVVIGLPPSRYGERAQIAAAISAVTPGEVRAVRSPHGARAAFAFDRKQTCARESEPNDELLVLDVGYSSTSFALCSNELVAEWSVGEFHGSHRAADPLVHLLSRHDLACDLHEAIDTLQRRSILHFGEHPAGPEVDEAVDALVQGLVERVEQLVGRVRIGCTRNIALAGGGARLIAGAIQRRWAHAKVLDDPLFANARGLCQHGLAEQRRRAVLAPHIAPESLRCI